jgi:hypothetical protein
MNARAAGRRPRPDVIHSSLYLPEAVHEALRESASVVSILSGVAGYVLGGISRNSISPEERSPQ